MSKMRSAGNRGIAVLALCAALTASADEPTVDPNNNFGTDQYEEFAANPSPDVPPPPADAPYRDPKTPLEERVNDLMGRLTPEEQATLLHAGGSLNMLAIPRIGLGDYRFTDGASGIRAEKRPGVTYMPNGIAWAATFDKDLMRENGRVQGEEVRAVYGHGPRFNGVCRMMLGPGANIARSPLCARNFEYLGEDPVLAGHLAGAFCQGLQMSRVSPTVKHYALNNQECMRTVIMVRCADRPLREIYTRAFGIACAQYGAWAVMNSYNGYNGDWTSNSWPLNSILIRDYGWDGAFVADWGGYRGDVEAINGGTSMETPGKYDAERNRRELKLLADGVIDRAKWEDAVRRVLRLSFRTGAFDKESADEKALQLRCEEAFRSEDHRKVSYAGAAESFVLLRNTGFLPLAPERIRTVAVVGPNADQYHTMMDGHELKDRGGSGAVKAAREITPLEGLCERFGRENVRFAPCFRFEGDQRRETAISVKGLPVMSLESAVKGADLVVFCAGCDHHYDREVLGWNFPTPSDRPDLLLQPVAGFPRQEDLIRRCAALNPNVVVAITAGGPVATAGWADAVKAIVMCWYAGEFQGRVLADMLCGDVNPSGRLPYTFGRRAEDWPCHRMGERVFPGVRIPSVKHFQGTGPESNLEAEEWYDDGIWVGYRGFEHFGTQPEYPFGFGLGYTTFAVRDLKLDGDRGASVEVVNTGKRKGRCVVQCYVSKPAQADAEMPVKELADFASVELEPGASGRVRFAFDDLMFKYWSEKAHGWRTAAGENRISVGFSSADLPLTAKLLK